MTISPERARTSDQHGVVRGVSVVADVAIAIGYRPPVGDDHRDSTVGITNKKITLAIDRSGNNGCAAVESGNSRVGIRTAEDQRARAHFGQVACARDHARVGQDVRAHIHRAVAGQHVVVCHP